MLGVSGQPYAYADDDPVYGTDPSGTITCSGFFSWVPGCGEITNAQNNLSSLGQSIWDNVYTYNPCANPGASSAAVAWPAFEGWGNCYQCAVRIEKILGGGRIIKISPPSGARSLGPSTNSPDGDWQYHYAVEKDRRMYDSFTGPEGLPIQAYQGQFDYWEYFDIDPGL
jgi:hypothetical protein